MKSIDNLQLPEDNQEAMLALATQKIVDIEDISIVIGYDKGEPITVADEIKALQDGTAQGLEILKRERQREQLKQANQKPNIGDRFRKFLEILSKQR